MIHLCYQNKIIILEKNADITACFQCSWLSVDLLISRIVFVTQGISDARFIPTHKDFPSSDFAPSLSYSFTLLILFFPSFYFWSSNCATVKT